MFPFELASILEAAREGSRQDEAKARP